MKQARGSIDSVREIHSENLVQQIWRLLRLFLDVPSTSERIRQIQEMSDDDYEKHKSNVRKQAEQLGYCIRQAEEYFQSSSQVGLATRPTLLYYGVVSLASALILLKQDGEYSFDARRKNKDKRHDHHGLDLAKGKADSIRPSCSSEDFLSSLQCNCHVEKDGSAWGTFGLFYGSLLADAIRVKYHKDIRPPKTGKLIPLPSETWSGDYLRPGVDRMPLGSVIGMDLNVLSMMRILPDMFSICQQLGFPVGLARGDWRMKVDELEPDEQRVVRGEIHHQFFIYDLESEQKGCLLQTYKKKYPDVKLIADYGQHLQLALKVEHVGGQDYLEACPDVTEDINGMKFYVFDPDNYLPEPASLFVVMYCLSMLARYYPDIWVNAIQSNVQVAELLDSLLNIVYRKFPNLILDQMTHVKHCIVR